MDEDLAYGGLLFARKKSKIPIILSYAVIVILVLLIFFYFFIGCAIVDGKSMENTLQDGQRCVLQRRGYVVERGDIVTIKHPTKSGNQMLIKRVIALGGDKILFVRSEGNKYVDLYICKSGESGFKLANEKYLKEGRMNYDVGEVNSKFKDRNGKIVPTVTYYSQEAIENIDIYDENLDYDAKLILDFVIDVPKNYIYYMGDNRNHSSDSRYYGPSKISDVTGKIIEIAEKGSALEGFLNFMFTMF